MTIKEPCKTLTTLMYLNQAMQSFCKGVEMSKGLLNDYQGALKDLDKVDFLEPNNAFSLQSHGDAKNMFKDYEPTFQDFDNANFLEPNNTFILQNRGDVKRLLEDYQGTLEDLDKVNVLEPNNAFTFAKL